MSRGNDLDADLEVDLQGGDTQSAATTATLAEGPRKAQVRYYSVGPTTNQVRCPLCQQDSKTETLNMAGTCGLIGCVFSVLSCCFPFFAVPVICILTQSHLKAKRVFCTRCAGHIGFYLRPT